MREGVAGLQATPAGARQTVDRTIPAGAGITGAGDEQPGGGW